MTCRMQTQKHSERRDLWFPWYRKQRYNAEYRGNCRLKFYSFTWLDTVYRGKCAENTRYQLPGFSLYEVGKWNHLLDDPYCGSWVQSSQLWYETIYSSSKHQEQLGCGWTETSSSVLPRSVFETNPSLCQSPVRSITATETVQVGVDRHDTHTHTNTWVLLPAGLKCTDLLGRVYHRLRVFKTRYYGTRHCAITQWWTQLP